MLYDIFTNWLSLSIGAFIGLFTAGVLAAARRGADLSNRLMESESQTVGRKSVER